MSSFTIRRATQNDLETLVSLRVAFLTETKPTTPDGAAILAESCRRYYAEHLRDHDCVAWLAEADGVPIGCGVVVFYTRPPRLGSLAGRDSVLLNVYTVPERRRQGVAGQLLAEIVAYVRATDARCLQLTSLEGSHLLYEKAGFRRVSDRMELHW